MINFKLDNEDKFRKWEVFIFLIVILSFILLGVTLFVFLSHTTPLGVFLPINSGIWADFGSLISGVVGSLFSFAAILLVYLTYQSQKLELAETKINTKHQARTLVVQQFENTFFNLLENHKNLYSSLIPNRTSLDPFISEMVEDLENYSNRNCGSADRKQVLQNLTNYFIQKSIATPWMDAYFRSVYKFYDWINKFEGFNLIFDDAEITSLKKNYSEFLNANLTQPQLKFIIYFSIMNDGSHFRTVIEKNYFFESIKPSEFETNTYLMLKHIYNPTGASANLIFP